MALTYYDRPKPAEACHMLITDIEKCNRMLSGDEDTFWCCKDDLRHPTSEFESWMGMNIEGYRALLIGRLVTKSLEL